MKYNAITLQKKKKIIAFQIYRTVSVFTVITRQTISMSSRNVSRQSDLEQA